MENTTNKGTITNQEEEMVNVAEHLVQYQKEWEAMYSEEELRLMDKVDAICNAWWKIAADEDEQREVEAILEENVYQTEGGEWRNDAQGTYDAVVEYIKEKLANKNYTNIPKELIELICGDQHVIKFKFIPDPDMLTSEDVTDVGTGVVLQIDRQGKYTAAITQRYDGDGKVIDAYMYNIFPTYETVPVEKQIIGEVAIENGDKKAAWLKVVDEINEKAKNL